MDSNGLKKKNNKGLLNGYWGRSMKSHVSEFEKWVGLKGTGEANQ
jgi:hypothetical protein